MEYFIEQDLIGGYKKILNSLSPVERQMDITELFSAPDFCTPSEGGEWECIYPIGVNYVPRFKAAGRTPELAMAKIVEDMTNFKSQHWKEKVLHYRNCLVIRLQEIAEVVEASSSDTKPGTWYRMC